MPQDENKNETKPEENKVETKPEEKAPESKPETIDVDLDGVAVKVDLETGKKLIEARQKAKKDTKDLQDKLNQALKKEKDATSKAALLEAMKAQDIESVKTQVAAEYLDKIKTYEEKIFRGEVKSTLATLGVVESGLDDATKLAMADVKVELKDGNVTLAEKPAKEFLSEWLKTKPHLVSVKQVTKNPGLQNRGSQAHQAKGPVNLENALKKFI